MLLLKIRVRSWLVSVRKLMTLLGDHLPRELMLAGKNRTLFKTVDVLPGNRGKGFPR
jgi:hypothetical protein